MLASLRSALCVCALVVFSTAACDNRALALGDPSAVELTLATPFMDGTQEVLTTVASLPGYSAETDADPVAFTVSSEDFGQGVELDSFEFRARFEVELTIRRFAEAGSGVRTLQMTIVNDLGTFEATAELTLFGTLR